MADIPRWVFLAAYTCSGLAALVYEVCWTRLLTLYLGHTTAAAATVVAAFMGGLAAGSFAGGRWASRLTRRQALHAYIAFEVAVALVAVVLPSELAALMPLVGAAYRNGSPGTPFAAIRLSVCLAVLFIPAFALGVTFPIAVRWFVTRPDRAGRAGGVLYAVNTAGAAAGALAAGFTLIPAIGVTGTTRIGIAANGVAAIAVLWLSRRPDEGRPATAEPRRRAVRRPEPARSLEAGWLAVIALGVSGFAALLYEIVWTRLLATIIGPSTYAFSAAVTAVITGTACGAGLGSAVAGRVRRPALSLAVTLTLAAIAAAASGSLAGGYVPRLVAHALAQSPIEFHQSVRSHALAAAALMLPTALALGAAFPLAFELVGARDDASAAGRFSIVYASNTVAAVAGSLAAGFVAIPRLGLQHTIDLVAVLLIVAAVVVIVFATLPATARVIGLVPVAVAVTILVRAPAWDRDLLASGVYKYPPYVDTDLDLEAALTAGTLVYYREGAASTVSVRRLTGTLSLAIDGKVDASSGGDMLTQKTLAHVPLLLHPDPHDVCVIGLGSGATLASALVHPIRRADVVEISPEVVEASRHFSTDTGDALADPRAQLVLGDGRSHLLFSSRTYDVIISEPSNPWMAGVATLFTREFFSAVRRRLAPGGIICQWAHTYDISDGDLRSIVATFLSVFPNATLWLVGESDVLLVASADRLDSNLAGFDAAWRRPGVAEDLAKVSVVEPVALRSLLAAGPRDLARYAANAAIQTDDRLALEFSGPRAVSARPAAENVARLRAAFGSRPDAARSAAEWRNRATMLFAAEDFGDAYDDYVKALRLEAADTAALDGIVRAAVAAHRESHAVELLTASTRAHPQVPAIRIAASRLLAAIGAMDQAVAAARQACDIRPIDPAALEQLASLYADVGDAAGLQPVVDELQRRYPDRVATQYYAAASQFLQQQLSDALRLAQQAVATDPTHAAARNLLGAIHASLGHRDEARAAFEAALRLNKRDSATYLNLGLLELSAQNRDRAGAYFAEALSLDPKSAAAREGLAETRR